MVADQGSSPSHFRDNPSSGEMPSYRGIAVQEPCRGRDNLRHMPEARILVVDDDPDIHALIAAGTADMPWHLDAAYDGLEGLEGLARLARDGWSSRTSARRASTAWNCLSATFVARPARRPHESGRRVEVERRRSGCRAAWGLAARVSRFELAVWRGRDGPGDAGPSVAAADVRRARRMLLPSPACHERGAGGRAAAGVRIRGARPSGLATVVAAASSLS